MPTDRISPTALQYFVYAVSAAIAEVEQGRHPVEPRTFREILVQQMLDIEMRPNLGAHDVEGVGDLRRRMIQMADDPRVRGRFDP